MASRFVPHAVTTDRPGGVSGMRPITLLIATAIALIAAILMVTGIAANHLREQALLSAESELARFDGVLAVASNASLNGVVSRLAEVAARLDQTTGADPAGFRAAAAAPKVGGWLRGQLGRAPRIQAIALVAADGEVLNQAGEWPRDPAVERATVAAMADPARGRTVGPPIRDPQTGIAAIPVVRRIETKAGTPLGAVVGIVPVADLTSLFATVPLAPDAVIAVIRPDGSVLARYPEAAGADASGAIGPINLDAVFGNPAATALRNTARQDGEWRMQAVRAMADFPAAVAVSRGARQVLAEWSHQIRWLAAFAVFAAAAIGLMVYLIARQFKIHADLAALRADRIEAEKIEIERARLAAETELLKSERLSVLGQLTATVAHELRNPLSAIRNTLFTVKELTAESGVKLDRPIARMERSIERCDRIISDLLEYTRDRELNRTRLRFDRWLADMLAEQSVPAPIVLSTELCAGNAVVAADSDRVRRVVINLVENAAQALAEMAADREKRIAVRTTIADGELVLTIADTGPGIAPENLSRIFEPLFSTKSFGTGLGLPTVKQIVNQHGGIIAVDSEVGRGTCVTVRLPLQAAEAVEDAKVAA
jgi:signal transduction histidine kinase